MLKRNRSAAWIEEGPAGRTLRRLDMTGELVLGSGPEIGGPADLALDRESTLYWTAGGLPRSAPLR